MDGSASWRGAPEQRGKTEGIGISALDGRTHLWGRRAAQGHGDRIGSSTQTFDVLRASWGGHSRAALQHPHGRAAVFAPPAVREAGLTHPTSTLAQVPARAVGRSVYRNVIRSGVNDVASRVDVVPHPGNVVLPLPDRPVRERSNPGIPSGVEVIAMRPLVHVQELQGIGVLDPAGTLSKLPRRHRSLQAYARRSSSPRMVNPCSTTRGGWA